MIKLFADETNSNDLGTSVLEKEPELKEPPLYQVILLNDDYTPMDFVVELIVNVGSEFLNSPEKIPRP